ncbi:metal tolerance protein C1 isoform X5 [Amborella trichopoda]|uniref:metal tolerance protein C1 isoform X5 n=1 Tax=Amborella trichopoda TaxID=13333 RepID=UPI0009BEBD80|nr:metal tolerance protein C1 isoform X5 [Amborella trichopoda]|eukprot:XP_020529806.1 metal tolerance protein C1 isoform X5 [Amborella trichopoda]
MGFRPQNLFHLLRQHHALFSISHKIPPSNSFMASFSLYNSSNNYNLFVTFEDNHYSKTSKRWHMGHAHHHHPDGKEADYVFRLGLGADIALAIGKSLTGYLSGSTAIIADAAHSISDIILSGVAWWSFRAARVPKDKEHPYGHGKFETLGALGISGMLLATAGGIAWHAVDVLQAILDYKKSWGKGREWTDESKCMAPSCRCRVLCSYPHWSCVMELVDAAVPQDLLVPIRHTILKVEGVKGCHHLRGRKAGSALYLDVHIEVDPFLSVSAAHDIGESVRHQLQTSHSEVSEVFIHIDPAISPSTAVCSPQKSCKSKKDKAVNPPTLMQHDAEEIVHHVLSSKFSEKMKVEHVTYHSLQGSILVQVLVSMPPELLIREAMEIACEAEKEILKADSKLSQVSIQLRLGNPIALLYHGTTVWHKI